MKEFLLLFRRDMTPSENQPSPEQLQGMMKYWQEWMGGLAAQQKLVSSGHRLEREGKVVKPGQLITDGPFVEIKETLGGYIVIRAASLEEAAELSKDCPILTINGTVEVRALIEMTL